MNLLQIVPYLYLSVLWNPLGTFHCKCMFFCLQQTLRRCNRVREAKNLQKIHLEASFFLATSKTPRLNLSSYKMLSYNYIATSFLLSQNRNILACSHNSVGSLGLWLQFQLPKPSEVLHHSLIKESRVPYNHNTLKFKVYVVVSLLLEKQVIENLITCSVVSTPQSWWVLTSSPLSSLTEQSSPVSPRGQTHLQFPLT